VDFVLKDRMDDRIDIIVMQIIYDKLLAEYYNSVGCTVLK
jgi:hypothetical protein